MRFIPELSVLLTLTISPLLVLGGLSLGFTITGEWVILAGGISVTFALATLARARRRFTQPLQTLIESLYSNVDTPGRPQPPELRQLLRAIRFYCATATVDAMDRINDLERQIQADINAREADDLLLEQERTVLSEKHSEILETTKNLDVQKLLARETAKKLLALANSNPLNPEALTELKNLQFLLSDSPHTAATESHDLLMLIDRVMSITAPLSSIRNTTFHVVFDPACPHHFGLDNGRFEACLFQLIIAYLQVIEPPKNKSGQVVINVGLTTGGFTLTFPMAPTLKQTAGLVESLAFAGAAWNNKTLTFPATLLHQKVSPGAGLTAIVLVDDEYVRSGLAQRLGFLGITCITDFNNQRLDICMVADETSEVFLSIKPYLPETTFVLMLNNRQHYQHPRWITVNDPVTQIQLEKIVSRIISTEDISTEKNILVVDDSEVNIQLLEIQLNELGHNVTIAGTGELAVSLATSHQFDMIFMDIQMPGIDGLQATRRIRQHNRSVPIVGLTAHATTEEEKEYRGAGMNDVLIKPAKIESLRDMTHKMGQPDAFPPLAESGTDALPIFDLALALANANDRPDLAVELFNLLLENLPRDIDVINAASDNIDELKRAVHRLHGTVCYCGVPRLARAIEKLELALKRGNKSEIRPLLNLLNGEVTALNTWHRDNPDVLGLGIQQIRHS